MIPARPAESEATRAARIAAAAHLCVCSHVQADPLWVKGAATDPGTTCAAIARGEVHHEWCPLRGNGAAPVRYEGHAPKRRRLL